MARRLEKHMERLDALNALGRPLVRRAKSRCELCSTSGVKLAPFEVPPQSDEPTLDNTLLLCASCSDGISNPKTRADNSWRFLEETVWSEHAAVQVLSVRLLRRFADQDAAWARATLDMVFLDEEVEAWSREAE